MLRLYLKMGIVENSCWHAQKITFKVVWPTRWIRGCPDQNVDISVLILNKNK
jgi:hypothetical protein